MGDCRVILDIRRGELVIIAFDVGNRSGIYD
ncbi:type II toxin-antitoxin system RelE family toxin [Lapillicoccus sp.]